jgi:hypothetical protein
MDDAIDEMQSTARAITFYEVAEFEPEIRDMAAIIINCAGLLAEALPLLRNIHANAARLHELIGRLVRLEGQADDIHDVGVVHGGFKAIVWQGLAKTSSAIVLSQVLGLLVSMLLILVTSWMFVRSRAATAETIFKRLHLVSVAAYSLGYGANDAQRTMGVIAVLLCFQGRLGGHFHVPGWVVLDRDTAIGLDKLSGGWKII